MKASEKAKTPLVIVTGLAVISLISGNVLWTKASVIIGLICIFSDFLSHWIIFLWMKLAEGLGWMSSKIILSVLFFVFLFPLSLAKKIFNADTMDLKKIKRDSLFETRNHQYTGEDMENTF